MKKKADDVVEEAAQSFDAPGDRSAARERVDPSEVDPPRVPFGLDLDPAWFPATKSHVYRANSPSSGGQY